MHIRVRSKAAGLLAAVAYKTAATDLPAMDKVG